MIPKVFLVPRMKPVECFLPIQTFLPWVIIQKKHTTIYIYIYIFIDSKHTRPPKRLNTLRVEWAPLKFQFTSFGAGNQAYPRSSRRNVLNWPKLRCFSPT